MSKTTLLRARVDSGRKSRAEKILGHYGQGLPFDLRPTETAELLANPKFKAHLARIKAGKVRYFDANDTSVRK